MSKRIMIDTMVCIWGLKETCSPGQEDKVARAKLYLKQLANAKHEIFISAVSLYEMMCDPNKIDEGIRALEKHRVAVLTLKGEEASLGAKLYRERNGEFESGKRRCAKCDDLILATARKNRIDLLITEDKKLQARAKKANLNVQPIGEVVEQPTILIQ